MKYAFITFLAIVIPKILISCSCSGSESFCHGAGPETYTVMVKVGEEISPGFYEFQIIENILNEVNADTIVLQSQNGWNCNASLHKFITNDTMIFHLWPTERFGPADTLDYVLTFCGTTFLYYSNGIVSGQIDFTINELGYQEFKSLIENCSRPTPINLTNGPKVFPNPTNGSVTIKSESKLINLEIYDPLGTKHPPEFDVINENTTVVDLSSLPLGLYFLKIVGIKAEEIVEVVKI